MILFLVFISFWLGLAITSAPIALVSVAIVFLLFVIKRFNKASFLISFLMLLLGFGFSLLKITYQKTTYQGIVYLAQENYILFNSGGERLYVYAKNHHYDLGDILLVEGEKQELSFTTIESSFDFKSYLNKKGVYHSLKAKHIDVKYHNFIRLHERREKLLSRFSKEERSIIGAILFSDGDDSELSSSLRELHLARFLASSGLFISAFYFVLKKLFGFILKDKYAEISSIGLLSTYTIFTFPRFSVIKVMLLLLLKWINKYPLKGKFSHLTILSALGIFSLLMNRYLAVQDSFILGFMIPIISYLSRHFTKKKSIKGRISRYLIIYLFFIPFEINYYNKVVILSLPLQIVMTPLFLLIGVISLLCFFYVPLYKANRIFIGLLKNITSFIKPLSFGILFPSMNQVLVVIYYTIYTIWLIYYSRGFILIKRYLLIGQLSLLTIYALPINNRITNEVNFINVGQGDCTLIRNHNKVALIDTGGLSYMDVANESLIPYLKKKRIYQIDMVIITHYDYDHSGALEGLKKNYHVKNVYDDSSYFPVTLGDITFTNYNYFTKSNEENENSLVISFRTTNKDYVVMGDAPISIEKEIIAHYASIPCDILKVGHHGSKTSTSEEWLDYLKPKEAIISCGKNNRYGHPHKEVITLLNEKHIKIRRTDLEGTIVYKQLSFK